MNRIISSISKKIKQTHERFEKGLSTMFKNESNDNDLNHIKPQKFQKVECYNIHESVNTQVHKEFKYMKDNEINQLISLNPNQMAQIMVYITGCFQEFKRGEIYISNEDLIKYQIIYDFIANQQMKDSNSDFIRKDLIDFIVLDMKKSHTRKGFKGCNYAKKEFKFYDEDFDN